MTHPERLAAFVRLGQRLRTLSDDELHALAARARNHNAWFDLPNVRSAVAGVAHLLEEDTLTRWAAHYPAEPAAAPRRVGVVMAGNIPMVGFHDLLCVLLSGHTLLAKLSADDNILLRWVADELLRIEPRFANRLQFVELLREADAFIATGSDNTARYFEYYFSKKPHLIRRNRSSLGVLAGLEPREDLAAFGADIFQYYGLGCRNVSKLLVPAGYDFTPLLDSLQPWAHVLDHHRYNNNYDYQKSLLLVNRVPHFDSGFLLLTESMQLVSPISVLHYSEYADAADLEQQLAEVAPQTQCVVSVNGWLAGSVPAGKAQQPSVGDYADGVDTMAFLTALA
ncbi:acyl-CoA reductase [Hymenobacter busanensis]|uniref:Acyl-CoA reductase n=1 Tax=Hymenobacter busanensis TaxID=2607656 RepID=A0A7L4ZYQ3_9BACT|nr:acyl-CoA reductase [Hymenobacter busanensis]KAA9339665.1 acyl-CoA reductase [Hymenobacter busanensis]QHJ06580.1 acyl-CoA reductase [Hymenobacter busanensis]